MTDPLPPVARVVRDRLAELDLTAADVCRATGLDKGTLSALLSGRTPDPRLSTVRAITRTVRLTPGQFEDRLRAAGG